MVQAFLLAKKICKADKKICNRYLFIKLNCITIRTIDILNVIRPFRRKDLYELSSFLLNSIFLQQYIL